MAQTPPEPDDFSSRALFQRARDPIFVLNRHRRIRFVNSAFEQLTKRKLSELYGKLCTRRRRELPAWLASLTQAMSPPPEALDGEACTARRPAPPARVGPPWWDIAFFPLAAEDGTLGIVGRIRVIGAGQPKPPRALPEALAALSRQLPKQFAFAALASDAPACAHVADQIRLATQHRSPVLITGEPGSGKRTVARIIHHHGPTAEPAFLEIDAASLPVWALEHHLDLAGSGRFGSVCIREPALLPRDLQARIAGMCADASVPVRWLATCGREPEHDVASGRLLSDLHLALSVQTIRLVPLRERLVDLARLSQSILERMASAGLQAPAVADEAFELLRAYEWPGNLRELDAVLQAAAQTAHGARIELAHLPEAVRASATRALQPAALKPDEPQWRLDRLLEAVERRMIQLALKKSKGNKTEAAALLGIWRPRLIRRMEALNLEPGEAPENVDDAPPADRTV